MKSLYATSNVRRIGPEGLIGGHGRHYNPGMFRYKEQLWMCYRGHGEPAPDPTLGGAIVAHCRLAIVRLDGPERKPAKAQWIPLAGKRVEDGRLFMHQGQPYIAFTELTKYDPGTEYHCVMKYAQLALKGDKWSVVQEWWPQYGMNDGRHREKNWQFFSQGGKLWAIYDTAPKHKILRIEGNDVPEWFDTPGPIWRMGHARGGTPPIPWGEGWLSIMHSSRKVPVPDASWKYSVTLRYHAAAYTFEPEPPFKVKRVSTRAILIGSDKDGFAGDPRNPKFEDPMCVFPCGLVEDGGHPETPDVLCSFGINNYQSALARWTPEQLLLEPNGERPFRAFFATENPIPATFYGVDDWPKTLMWRVNRRPVLMGETRHGYMEVDDPCDAESIGGLPLVREISEAEFRQGVDR